jgi:hypothetical protein
MSEIRQITLRGATGTFRTAVFESRDYVVVPVIALVEGVIHALNAAKPELVLATEFGVAAAGWNGRPVVHNHPTVDGKPVSANSPKILEQLCFGRVFDSHVADKELRMEAWLDIAKAASLGGSVQQTVDRVLDGKSVEVSVGVFIVAEAQQGVYNGKEYGSVWRDLVPDHLAFLEDGHVGACSNEMGCGVRAAAVHLITAEGITPMSEAAPKRTLRERLKDIMPFRLAAKGYSDNDVRDSLRKAIQTAESNFAYIDSVFESDGYVIYCTANMTDPSQPYTEQYYKRSFTLDKASGSAALSDDRTPVEPVMTFEPIAAAAEAQPRAACSCEDNPKPSESDKENMDRKDRIQALIANDRCVIKTPAALEALSDGELTALEESLKAAVHPPAPVAAPAPAAAPVPAPAPAAAAPAKDEPQTLQAWMATAPPEVQEMVNRHAAQDAATKKDLVESLKAAQKTYTEARLQEMSIQQLQEVSELLQIEAPRAAVDFSARNPLPRAAASNDVPSAWDAALGKAAK